jgi:CubicO group peptidase (beta-lactamase class C family)
MSGLRPPFRIAGEAPIRWTLADRMKFYHTPGLSVAVIDSGRIVWARGFGVKEAGGIDSVTPTTIFQAGSISKPTFALGVMRLVQDGRLNLDENVNDKLKSWKVPDNRFTPTEKVTLRRILSHNAGLTVHGFPGYEAGAPIPTVVQVLNGEKSANTPPVRVDTFPGAISRYSGGGTTIAMLLVEDVTGKPFPEFMKETVLDPAGMTHSTYEQPLPVTRRPDAASGHESDGRIVKGKYHTYPEMAPAGLWTTPSDLATLAIELQRTYAGQWDKIVSQGTFKEMLTVQKAPFGIGYVVRGTGQDLDFEHDGQDEGFVATFIAYAERGQGVMMMSNGNNGSLLAEILPSIVEEYGWPTHHQDVKTIVALTPQRIEGIAGKYRFTNPGFPPIVAAVLLEGGKVFLIQNDTARTELLADTDSTFFDREEGVSVVFDRDPRGRVIALTAAGQARGKKIQ